MSLPADKLDPRSRLDRALDAVLVLVRPAAATKRLAAADFEVTKKRQPELLNLSAEALEQHRWRITNVCSDRVRRLRTVHARALLLILSAVGAGVLVARIAGAVPDGLRPVLAAASVGVFAWATLARLGWAGQSMKGDTAIERIDEVWFRLLYWLGTALATISLS